MHTKISLKKLLGGYPFTQMKEQMKLSTKCVEKIPVMLQEIFDNEEDVLKEDRNKVFDDCLDVGIYVWLVRRLDVPAYRFEVFHQLVL